MDKSRKTIKPPKDSERCTYVKPDKARCRNPRVSGDDKCFVHSPKKAKERKAARAKGGRNSRKPMQAVDKAAAKLAFAKSMDVIAALEEVFDKVSKGEIDYRIGQTLGTLGATMLKGLQHKESDDQDVRIASLARQLEAMNRKQSHDANENGQEEAAGANGAAAPKGRRDQEPGEDPSRWLAGDDDDFEETRSVADLDAAEPLW